MTEVGQGGLFSQHAALPVEVVKKYLHVRVLILFHSIAENLVKDQREMYNGVLRDLAQVCECLGNLYT